MSSETPVTPAYLPKEHMPSSGCYPLTELNTCDNIITNVEVEELPDEDYGPCSVAECYGTGWWLSVSTAHTGPSLPPEHQ